MMKTKTIIKHIFEPVHEMRPENQALNEQLKEYANNFHRSVDYVPSAPTNQIKRVKTKKKRGN